MCLYIKEGRSCNNPPVPKIAEENIEVLKAVTPCRDGLYKSLYWLFFYKDGGYYELQEELRPRKSSDTWAIDEGFHSYKTIPDWINHALSVDENSNVGKSCIIKCIIPKGAKYFEGIDEEMVSDKLVVVKRIDYP